MACSLIFAFHTNWFVLTLTQSGVSQENAPSQLLPNHSGLRTITYEVDKQAGQNKDKNGNIMGQICLV